MVALIFFQNTKYITLLFLVNLLLFQHSFFKQFYGSVNELDYTTLRRGFINVSFSPLPLLSFLAQANLTCLFLQNHYRDNPKFNFYKYMLRALETDFKKVVGIRSVFSHPITQQQPCLLISCHMQLVFVDSCGAFLAAQCSW